MPISVVVGGQFGSEGKGKISRYLAENMNASAVVRVGGPNSGHSVVSPDGKLHIFRHLPTSAVLDGVLCIIGPGSYIDPNILMQEIYEAGLDSHRLIIDGNATILTEEDIQAESKMGLMESIASTGSGTGAAVARRIQRKDGMCLAAMDSDLLEYVGDTTSLLRHLLSNDERIIIEGSQGFGLSLTHSPYYPNVTSRDTTAASFVAEAGMSPMDVDDIVMVLRSYPIRVGGNSGYMANEVNWDFVSKDSGGSKLIQEYTSVTKSLRRVAMFDPYLVNRAIQVNAPTRIAMNHVDYFDSLCRSEGLITLRARDAIDDIELKINRKIDILGFGPSNDDITEIRIDG